MANTRDTIGDQATVDGLVNHTLTSLEEDGIGILHMLFPKSNALLGKLQFPFHIWHHLLREGNGKPEEGTAPQIKGQTSAHIAAQINIWIPEKAAASNGPMGQYIEGHLLYVVISVIKEDPAVINQKGKDRCLVVKILSSAPNSYDAPSCDRKPCYRVISLSCLPPAPPR